MKMIEHRTRRRLEANLLTGVSVLSNPMYFLVTQPQFHCQTLDVSVRGMKLLADRPLPEGAEVKLWVKLNDDDPVKDVKLRGRVCWATGDQHATGKFLAGIRLDAHPSPSAAVWSASIYEWIRKQYCPAPVRVGVAGAGMKGT